MSIICYLFPWFIKLNAATDMPGVKTSYNEHQSTVAQKAKQKGAS